MTCRHGLKHAPGQPWSALSPRFACSVCHISCCLHADGGAEAALGPWDPQCPFSGRFLAEPFHIGGSEREDLRQLWRALHSGPNAKPVQVALRRWSAAADRVEEEDKLID